MNPEVLQDGPWFPPPLLRRHSVKRGALWRSLKYVRVSQVLSEKGNKDGTGFGWGSHWVALDAGLRFFGSRHFLETGTQILIGLNDDTSPVLKVAYCFQGSGGITIRLALPAYFTIDPYLMPLIGMGYAF